MVANRRTIIIRPRVIEKQRNGRREFAAMESRFIANRKPSPAIMEYLDPLFVVPRIIFIQLDEFPVCANLSR
jgi:hypothetical protein